MSRDRDRKLEQALEHELRHTGTPDRDACVDAETLAAWAEGGLDAAQMAAVEVHVSSCGRCQAIVGAAARSAPVIAPVISTNPFRFPRWALAPLAAAAAITIWMVVPQDTIQAPPTPAPVAIQREESAAKKDRDAPARDAAIKAQQNERSVASEAPPPVAPAGKIPEGKRERGQDAPAFEDRRQRPEERTADALGAVAAAPPRQETVAAPAAPAAPAAEAMLQKSARLGAATLEIVSPDPSSRWRIVNNSIERSEDGGASWVPIRAPGGETFTGGASPARSVCWLIGSNGLVMVAADGVAFARVPLPEPVALTAIAAADARTATVTTADGRRFRTGDSGRTWRRF